MLVFLPYPVSYFRSNLTPLYRHCILMLVFVTLLLCQIFRLNLHSYNRYRVLHIYARLLIIYFLCCVSNSTWRHCTLLALHFDAGICSLLPVSCFRSSLTLLYRHRISFTCYLMTYRYFRSSLPFLYRYCLSMLAYCYFYSVFVQSFRYTGTGTAYWYPLTFRSSTPVSYFCFGRPHCASAAYWCSHFVDLPLCHSF
jgi:hypothetical protein